MSDDKNKGWQDFLKRIGCDAWGIEFGSASNRDLIIRAYWPKKANGTGYDYTVWVRVYPDGSFGAMLDAQRAADLDELKAMAAASYAICRR